VSRHSVKLQEQDNPEEKTGLSLTQSVNLSAAIAPFVRCGKPHSCRRDTEDAPKKPRHGSPVKSSVGAAFVTTPMKHPIEIDDFHSRGLGTPFLCEI